MTPCGKRLSISVNDKPPTYCVRYADHGGACTSDEDFAVKMYRRQAFPAPGEFETRVGALEDAVSALATATPTHEALELLQRTVVMLDDLKVRIDFTRRLEAFFGPLLQDKTPPLNGDEVPTKAWVDKSLERLASSLRAEMRRSAMPPTPLRLWPFAVFVGLQAVFVVLVIVLGAR